MLFEATGTKALGKDVVIGYIEPHDRPDTNSLLAGFAADSVEKSNTKGSR